MPQSRAAMAVARALDPQPGERILDLCAAPGGKTTHLAALIRDEGRIVAVEKHAGPRRGARRTAQRMGATCVEVRTADATTGRRATTTACWSTRRARTSARSPPGPTSAGASSRRRRRHWRAHAGADPRPGRRAHSGREACSSTRPARSPRSRTSALIAAFLERHTTSPPTGCRQTCRSGTIRPCPAASRRSRTGTGRTASSSHG